MTPRSHTPSHVLRARQGLGDIFNSVWAAASPNRQQRRNSHSLPPASETEAPGVPSQTLALARASTVASSHPSDVDDSAMTSAHSGLAAQVRAKKEVCPRLQDVAGCRTES